MRSGNEQDPDWHLRALAAVHALMGPGTRLDIRATPRTDHLVGAVTCPDGSISFVKAFAPGHTEYFETELNVYLSAAPGTIPTLQHTDPQARVLITEYCIGGRLGDLPARDQSSHIERLPLLFAGLVDLPTPKTSAPDRTDFATSHAAISLREEAIGLPAPHDVLAILKSQPLRPVHGDFHPLNVLIGDDGVRAVDFESYGLDAPGLDIVRMSYNPMLYIDAETRLDLARAIVESLSWADGKPTTRDLAACCVYWAVCCAAYFSTIVAEDAEVARRSPEVLVLATEPLKLASDLWNQPL